MARSNGIGCEPVLTPHPLTCAAAPSSPIAALVPQHRRQGSPKAGSPGRTLATPALTAVLEVRSRWKMQLGIKRRPRVRQQPLQTTSSLCPVILGESCSIHASSPKLCPRISFPSFPLVWHKQYILYFSSPAPLQTFSTGEGKYLCLDMPLLLSRSEHNL